MEPRYRILFLDIDGTLVGASGIVPERTVKALRAAQAAGCLLVVCTGRNRHAAGRVATQIGGHGFGIVLNGAVVFEWETGDILRRTLLTLDVAARAIRIARAAGRMAVW